MKTIKVLYSFSGSRADTGSPRAMLRMIDSLDRGRFRPVFVTSTEGTLADEMRSRKVDIIGSEVASVSLSRPIKLFASVRDKHRLLQQFGIDVIHMNEPGWNSDIVFAARVARIPVILHLHNAGVVSGRNLNYAIARKVFMCSAAQSKAVVNFERIRDKVVVLHNAVDVDQFASGRPIRKLLGLSDHDTVIGTIAQVSHRKGIDLFLDAAEILLRGGRKLKFVIVGPKAVREEDYFRAMMERINQGLLQGNVYYFGSRNDVPDVLASFDVFFLPTRAEPFGMVVIEAMAAGVPVVVSAVGGIPEIVTTREIGLTVDASAGTAYADALDEVLRMGTARKALGERGRRSLSGRFDLPRMGATLGSVYEQLVAP